MTKHYETIATADNSITLGCLVDGVLDCAGRLEWANGRGQSYAELAAMLRQEDAEKYEALADYLDAAEARWFEIESGE